MRHVIVNRAKRPRRNERGFALAVAVLAGALASVECEFFDAQVPCLKEFREAPPSRVLAEVQLACMTSSEACEQQGGTPLPPRDDCIEWCYGDEPVTFASADENGQNVACYRSQCVDTLDFEPPYKTALRGQEACEFGCLEACADLATEGACVFETPSGLFTCMDGATTLSCSCTPSAETAARRFVGGASCDEVGYGFLCSPEQMEASGSDWIFTEDALLSNPGCDPRVNGPGPLPTEHCESEPGPSDVVVSCVGDLEVTYVCTESAAGASAQARDALWEQCAREGNQPAYAPCPGDWRASCSDASGSTDDGTYVEINVYWYWGFCDVYPQINIAGTCASMGGTPGGDYIGCP
ncbi:MAG: hypothetical protein KC468_24670 [Myxococcales bacterium]|nr:hypothetical protein [Myxococcales bacterium]